jgi:hypothetical protein
MGHSGRDGVPGVDPSLIKLQEPPTDAGCYGEGSLVQAQQPQGVTPVWCLLDAGVHAAVVMLLVQQVCVAV